jgi:hypothetical protein
LKIWSGQMGTLQPHAHPSVSKICIQIMHSQAVGRRKGMQWLKSQSTQQSKMERRIASPKYRSRSRGHFIFHPCRLPYTSITPRRITGLAKKSWLYYYCLCCSSFSLLAVWLFWWHSWTLKYPASALILHHYRVGIRHNSMLIHTGGLPELLNILLYQ